MQEAPALRFAVIFGGFHRGGERLQGDKLAQEAFQEGVLLPHPSCHVIGEKDALRKVRASGSGAWGWEGVHLRVGNGLGGRGGGPRAFGEDSLGESP